MLLKADLMEKWNISQKIGLFKSVQQYADVFKSVL